MARFQLIIAIIICVGCNPAHEKLKADSTNTVSDEIRLTSQQIQLGNIKTDTLHKENIGEPNTLLAIVNINENKTSSVSSRVMGRIEKLYFKTKGDFINKGDKLYDIYSEELNVIKQEYLLALQKRDLLHNDFVNPGQLITSSKNKLRLYGITEKQLKDISSSPITTMFSPARGYVTELPVKEGDYVMEGAVISKIANLSSLWVEAQVYPTQLKGIYLEADAVVSIPDFPEKALTGKIDFINPELNSGTQLGLIRIAIPNNDLLIRPGMQAIVTIKNHVHRAITLPMDAVIRDSKGAIVWVQTGVNIYKSRMIKTGIESGDRIEIISGLSEGDVVVTSGVYPLNSEFIFKQGKKNSMEGMKM